MELKIGDKYGCLEVIGGCEEAEVDIAPIIKQLAEKEWNKFEYNRYRIFFLNTHNLQEMVFFIFVRSF